MDRRPILCFALVLAYFLGAAVAARADIIGSTKEWTGQLEDGTREKAKPAGGVIADKDEFAKLWRAWMGKEELPQIDFGKELVVVASSNKGRIFGIHLIDAKGDATAAAAFKAGQVKGFNFAIAVFKREGIKSIDGKPIKK